MDETPCPTCADCPTCGGRRFLPEIKICANTRCGKEFRWQDEGEGAAQKWSKGVIYCSRRCARNVTKQRARERARVLKWANSESPV